MQPYVNGGVPGLARLQKIARSLFNEYGIHKVKEQERIYSMLGLSIVPPKNNVAQFEIEVPQNLGK
jgi:hypothetical protein